MYHVLLSSPLPHLPCLTLSLSAFDPGSQLSQRGEIERNLRQVRKLEDAGITSVEDEN